MAVRDGALVISPAGRPRLGWDDAFRRMAVHADDALLDAETPLPTAFDEESWEWK